jgi:hypothetical protein
MRKRIKFCISHFRLDHSETIRRTGRNACPTSLFNQIGRNFASLRVYRDLQQPLKILRLLFVKLNEFYAEPATGSVMPDFAFQVEPIVVRQQHAEADNFTSPDLANRVEKTTTLRKVSNTGAMGLRRAVPHCIETDS